MGRCAPFLVARWTVQNHRDQCLSECGLTAPQRSVSDPAMGLAVSVPLCWVGILWTVEPPLPDSHPLLQAQRSGDCGLPTKKHSVAAGLALSWF